MNRLSEYINETKYEVKIREDEVYILNYIKIVVFDDDVIIIDLGNQLLTIKGKSIIINKLLNSEMLVKGKIKSIEIR